MAPEYRLIDNHIIAATLLDTTTGQFRESTLDLDYCLSRNQLSGNEYVAARAPKSFTNPDLVHTTASLWKISDKIKHRGRMEDIMTAELNGSVLHIRNEVYMLVWWNLVYDSYIELNDYVRVTKTGRLEWLHPPYEARIPEWLQSVLEVATAMSKTPGNAFEMAVDMAKDQLTAGLFPEVKDYSKEWMKDTYVDNGQLVRHGS